MDLNYTILKLKQMSWIHTHFKGPKRAWTKTFIWKKSGINATCFSNVIADDPFSQS